MSKVKQEDHSALTTADKAGRRMGWPRYTYASVGSTMDVAKRLAEKGAPEGTLVLAERQTAGRGRQRRPWDSPKGGLYLSLILRPTRPTPEVPQLSLVAGLAAAEAVQEASGLSPCVKWPNDLLLRERKVAGLLVETSNGAVVLGIGINVTTPTRLLPEAATSLVAEGWTRANPRTLAAALCRHLGAWYDICSSNSFAPIREALRPWMGHFGQRVSIASGSKRFEGTASDLDESGRLLVRLDTGILQAFEMGEVTLLRQGALSPIPDQ